MENNVFFLEHGIIKSTYIQNKLFAALKSVTRDACCIFSLVVQCGVKKSVFYISKSSTAD